jgi:hypothetical protein
LAQFRDTIGLRVERAADTAYAFQELEDLPARFSAQAGHAAGRAKQWGTAHAVYCARKEAGGGNLLVANADDFYGRGAFARVAEFLAGGRGAAGVAGTAGAVGTAGAAGAAGAIDAAGAASAVGAVGAAGAREPRAHYCMAGFLLENTLSPNGHVSRGVCDISGDGFLAGITEKTKIQENGGAVQSYENGAWAGVPRDAIVSMNCWGFTQAVFGDIEAGFGEFFSKSGAEQLKTREYYLPDAIRRAIDARSADVAVIRTAEKWHGVTYREDKVPVSRHIAACVRGGLYPPRLWA